MLQQQVTQYKARAAAARDPALYPVLAALPRAPAQARNADGSGFNQSIIDGLIAGAVIVIALDLLLPSTPSSGSCVGGCDPSLQNALNEMNRMTCARQVSLYTPC
jgi:hypothetical protein